MPLDGYSIIEPFIYTFKALYWGWWIIVPVYLLILLKLVWEEHFVNNWLMSLVWKNLMITVPKENERGARYMEQFYAAFHSVITKPNVSDWWLEGKRMPFISLELISIEGTVRFIIRTPDSWVRHIQAQIYAQYPDSEIDEIEDYTKLIPQDFLDQGYDMTGTQFEYTDKAGIMPIRTYTEFEVKDQETDTMAPFVEYLSNIQKGQYAWYQILIQPQHVTESKPWGAKVKKAMDEIIASHKTDPVKGGISAIPQHEQELLKALSNKMSKRSFNVKLFYLHVARKEAWNKPWAVNGGFGPMQQFDSGVNGIKPNGHVFTKVEYFFKDSRERWRKKAIMNAMKNRQWSFGASPLVMNAEELATLYHFPISKVKIEHVESVVAKKAAAPRELPVAPL